MARMELKKRQNLGQNDQNNFEHKSNIANDDISSSLLIEMMSETARANGQ